MKSLIIAEKPSVARDIARALGKTSQKDDHYEGESYVISSAIGHLVELFMPEDIDKKLKGWSFRNLPILPEQFGLKPIEKSKKKFLELKKLLKRRDIDTVVNACDAGREGELIFTYLYELSECRKPVQRMWMLSMTPASIREAFQNLRQAEAMKPLQDAARCRSESDWLIGINGTRAVTSRMFGFQKGRIATVGRVQTPTLTLVIEREREIRNFEPRTFWRILGEFQVAQGSYQGVCVKTDFRKGSDPHDRADRLWEKDIAEAIAAAVRSQPLAEVSEEKKRSTQSPPRLYDLTTLQREANNRFSLSARVTLQAAQALYETHKMITYPRTDSRALPEDYPSVCRNVLGKLEDPRFHPYAREVLDVHGVPASSKRIFNNQQISDHFAIIPTEITNGKLSDVEAKVYTLIVHRFIAIFFPPAEYDVTTRLSTIDVHTFKTEGRILVKPGWKAVYGQTTGQEKDVLPALSVEDGAPPRAQVISVDVEEDATKPPPRYTEATLLASMESAGKFIEDDDIAEALKEKGLGTPATRAQIIEHLINLKYMERQQRDLLPTQKAEDLIDFLKAVKIEDLTSPVMTGEWEYQMRQIENNRLSRETFMRGIKDMTRQIVDRAREFKEEEHQAGATDILSPTDGKPLIERLRTYRSQDGAITIYKTIGQRKLELDELCTLLSEGKVGPLDGFRSRSGKPFSAMLVFDKEGCKVRFAFEDAVAEKDGSQPVGTDKKGTLLPSQQSQDFSQFPSIGPCPQCSEKKSGDIVETPSAYLCTNNKGRDRLKGECTFRVGRTILGRIIPRDQFLKLIQERKTDLLDSFRSKRTQRLFSAYLILKDDGSIGFEFAPRKGRSSGPKKASQKPMSS